MAVQKKLERFGLRSETIISKRASLFQFEINDTVI